jgi:hypothetical protein
MPTFRDCLKTRPSPFSAKKSTQILQEGTELTSSELVDELTSTQVHSITATVVADHAEELTVLLRVHKWNGATNKTADSFTQHPDTAQTNALVDR